VRFEEYGAKAPLVVFQGGADPVVRKVEEDALLDPR
jgi:hypothetical protein